jgi:hypothetical protein
MESDVLFRRLKTAQDKCLLKFWKNRKVKLNQMRLLKALPAKGFKGKIVQASDW